MQLGNADLAIIEKVKNAGLDGFDPPRSEFNQVRAIARAGYLTTHSEWPTKRTFMMTQRGFDALHMKGGK